MLETIYLQSHQLLRSWWGRFRALALSTNRSGARIGSKLDRIIIIIIISVLSFIQTLFGMPPPKPLGISSSKSSSTSTLPGAPSA